MALQLNRISWQQKLRQLFQKKRMEEIDFEQVEDLLLEADIGAAQTMDFSRKLRELAFKQKISDAEELPYLLGEILLEALPDQSLELDFDRLQVILLLGVNGVGKTTTLAKLAYDFRSRLGIEKITIGAGDTFRAAAADQLRIHAERLGLRLVAQKPGSDSAAVIYDTVSSAHSRGQQLALLDTAGRMHTRELLLAELRKIERVLDRLTEKEQRHYLLVVDATTGRNALDQAKAFADAVPLKGVILSKWDTGFGGGVIFSLYRQLGLNVLYIGSGEQYTDLSIFRKVPFVAKLLGISETVLRERGGWDETV